VYSAILDRPDETILVDDLDSLQTDLQALHTSIQRRIQLLESELVILNDWQVKRDYNRKRKLSDASEVGNRPSSVTKRQKTDLEPTPPPRHTKKNKTHPTEAGIEPHSSKHKSKGKGDAPDRFWAAVEPYCADITEADIHLLQEDLKNMDGDEVHSVPALGRHYSRHWAMEDMEEERREAGRAMENVDTGNRGSDRDDWQKDSESLLKQAESLGRSSKTHCPLTQRLMAAFIEDSQESGRPPLPPQERPSPILNIPSTRALEDRIKDELTLLGIFEPPEMKEEKREEDEILMELTRKQAELKAVSEFNRQQLQTLVSLARTEIERQEIRKEVQEADEEVMDCLKRFVSARQKKRSVGRKEREMAWKALEKRDLVYQRLDQI
jgi:transcriptional adapter 3